MLVLSDYFDQKRNPWQLHHAQNEDGPGGAESFAVAFAARNQVETGHYNAAWNNEKMYILRIIKHIRECNYVMFT